MFRGRLLLFWLLASSLFAATTVHAQEAPLASILGTECAADAHYQSDTGQDSGDADKVVHHQHGGCHGHHVTTGASAGASTGIIPDAGLLLPHDPTALARSATDPALRPPIA